MSNSLGGIKQRLKQFINGTIKGRGHSAGNRLFKKENPFDIVGYDKTFFVASLSLPCIVNKNKRISRDLRRMGDVAKFEYEVIAFVKEKLGKEPALNKK